jgi:transposase
MVGVVEIITGRERRRRWSNEQKLGVVAETQEPGSRVRDVAARHGVCESLVFTWRRQVREGILVGREMPVFTPVQMLEAAHPAGGAGGLHSEERSEAHSAAIRPPLHSGLIEIALGDGRQVRVGSDVNLAALRRVLAALRG